MVVLRCFLDSFLFGEVLGRRDVRRLFFVGMVDLEKEGYVGLL